MEAKDMVLTSRDAVFDPIQDQIQRLLNTQAEISFKLGMKEVMEWGIQPCLEHVTGMGVFTRRECPKCWQALLKEKGLE